MRELKRITLLRSGNRLVVGRKKTSPKVKDLLTPHLRYTTRTHFHGQERAARIRANLPPYADCDWECYAEDVKGRLATSYGFCERIRAVLTKAGYEPTVQWATETEAEEQKQRAATVYKARWDRIEAMVRDGFKYRYRQKKALQLIAENQNGRIDCHTGWGKGTLIMLAAMLFPKAKIDVVSKRVAVVHTRLYPELALNLPSVGLVGGGRRILGRRVMCFNADSLHYGRPDADFVFVDEGHEACADGFAEKLGIYDHARMFAFSASWDLRLDNKDMRGEAMFGPIRLVVPYSVGVEKGIVVPIEVYWTDVIMDENPCGDETRLDLKKRYGIWTNEYRNKLIAADANKYDADTQVLITVETLEHALNLKTLLPDFKIVYSGQGLGESEIRRFRKRFPDEFRPMTRERLAKMTKRFETGRLKKVIVTTVWNVGVDFRHLEVLIRGDGGGSPVNDIQIPGRNSRKKKDADVAAGAKEKFVGIVHDYRDQFDSGFRTKAGKRRTSYTRIGWKQHEPDKSKRSKLRTRMNMGSVV